MKRPIVLVVTRRTIRKHKPIDYVGEYHLELLIRLKILPVMVPVVKNATAALAQYRDLMGGLLLVEGEDIEPSRYRAQEGNYQYLEKTHAIKDAVEFRLLRHALRNKLPVLGICRGCQLLNAACGGTLYGDVLKEKNSTLRHIESDIARYDAYRHPVSIVGETPLAKWYGQKDIQVNSYHHQGVRELASRFRAMAHAPDGLVEAFYDPKAEFVVGLQFHPERMLADYAGNWQVWKAFGAAVQRRQRRQVVG